jgi:methenyltetrahydrofolate cyclohydrolase
MKLTDRTVSGLLEAFRSSDPTPGGGSAAALAGAVGASLLAMVAGLPKPVAATDAELGQLRDAGERCTSLARELEALIDQDTDAYDAVVAAYRLPKATDEDKAARSHAIQSALRGATETPLTVMRRCQQALELSGTVGRLGNQNAASDVQVAGGLLRAGLSGAAANVDINLGSVKDAAYVAKVRAEMNNAQ